MESAPPGCFFFAQMHLLYLDDSGSANNANESHLVLGGVSVFEAQAHWVTRELDKLAVSFGPQDPNALEFHASEIYAGRGPWQGMPRLERYGVIKNVLGVLQQSYDSARAFVCAVHKTSYPRSDPMELAFEDLCSRFDLYLKRISTRGDRQRGLIILDNSSYETSLQKLARDFRSLGTRWGVINTIAETPMFLDSRASRVIQLADHVAYAAFRRYESGDAQFFDLLNAKFDSDAAGKLHGLSHKQTNDPHCMCPSCLSRRIV